MELAYEYGAALRYRAPLDMGGKNESGDRLRQSTGSSGAPDEWAKKTAIEP